MIFLRGLSSARLAVEVDHEQTALDRTATVSAQRPVMDGAHGATVSAHSYLLILIWMWSSSWNVVPPSDELFFSLKFAL